MKDMRHFSNYNENNFIKDIISVFRYQNSKDFHDLFLRFLLLTENTPLFLVDVVKHGLSCLIYNR